MIEYCNVDETIKNYKKYCSDFTFKLKKNFRKLAQPPGYHDCFFNKKKKLIFLHIDKCASSSLSEFFSFHDDFIDMSWRISNIKKFNEYLKKNNYTFYAVIRDPNDRYISGLQEFFKRYYFKSMYIESQLINQKFIFDEHTSPQWCSILKCDDNNIEYIKMDKNLEEKISKIIGTNVYLPKNNISEYNIKTKCKNLFKKYCENNKNFLDLYQKDFDLYKIAN